MISACCAVVRRMRRQRLRSATAMAFLASVCPTMCWLSASTTCPGVRFMGSIQDFDELVSGGGGGVAALVLCSVEPGAGAGAGADAPPAPAALPRAAGCTGGLLPAVAAVSSRLKPARSVAMTFLKLLSPSLSVLLQVGW